MLPDRNTRIRELSIILKWLRHRENLVREVVVKYEIIMSVSPSQPCLGMVIQYRNRLKVLGYLIGHVTLDLRTIASHGKAPSSKGRKPK